MSLKITGVMLRDEPAEAVVKLLEMAPDSFEGEASGMKLHTPKT